MTAVTNHHQPADLDDLSALAGIAGGDSRVVRGLVGAEARRRAADADSARRLREREVKSRLARDERAARQERATQVANDRAVRREAARTARQARSERARAARAVWLASRVAYVRANAVNVYCAVVYGTAVGGAVYGQVTNVELGPVLIRVVIAVALEGLALAMALTALQQRLAGERALAARVLTWVSALVAAGINLTGHTGHQAVVLATLSLTGIVVWEIRSGAKHRATLRDLGVIPAPPAQFGWRRWVCYPLATWRAWSLDVRDRVTGRAASLLARVEEDNAARRREGHRRQVAAAAARAARKATRKGDTDATLAALTKLATTCGAWHFPATAPAAPRPDTSTAAGPDMFTAAGGHRPVTGPDTFDSGDVRSDIAPVRSLRRTGRPDTAAAVAKLRAERPDMTQEAIAKRLGISDRTVRRHINGHAPGVADPSEER